MHAQCVEVNTMTELLERYRALMESSPDAVSLIDPQGEIWYASASAGVVLGYEPEELVGRN